MNASSDPKIHGEWSIQALPSCNTILIKGRGGWNGEAAIAYCEEFKDKVIPLFGVKWACLGYGMDWELGTPDIEVEISRLYEWMVENGCVLQVTVMRSAMSEAQISRLMNVSEPGYQVFIVDSTEEALQILERRGFAVPEAQLTRFIEAPY
ncbi:hypothetical protein QTP81_01980 [Alteromonas sp. ASW11-36]|uniref:Uncharacterized protein n=1 Tax=Alteromonas arenosi TaxID=3055817 RepID=A0ABT7ST57_9ALTE|nr:hypothetical protein [Alteromonas sp. ASW11-36]MDM7859373.1 hypothetical protein [Alteromonas sp. ASW11-36]